MIPVVFLIRSPWFFSIQVLSILTARCSPLMEADVMQKSSMNVPQRITYGTFFPLRVVPNVYRYRMAYDTEKLNSQASR